MKLFNRNSSAPSNNDASGNTTSNTQSQSSSSANPSSQNPGNHNKRNNFYNRNYNRNSQGSNHSSSQGTRNSSNKNKSRSGNRNERRFGGSNNRGSNNYNQGRSPKTEKRQVYNTANALMWGNNSSYNFHSADASHTVKIIPISGLEDVGTNCTLIEHENDIIIIDAGIGFPGDRLPGVDGTIPNLKYLDDKRDRVRGLIITHGHMDHIGGIHHLIDKIGFPTIYAPKLAAGLIRERLKETTFANNVKIVEYDGDSTYYLGKFHISHFKMTHTIPDNYGISIQTPIGRIVTPSDFKFDLAPYRESPSDYAKLTKMGDEGVLLIMHESTNAHKAGWCAAETDIAKDLENIIRDTKGRLMIGMFSTMVNRIRQVIELADRHHKKVAVLGRSLENIVKISHGLGYIDVLNSIFVPFDQINNIPDDQLIIITTGSQGEPNAALMRMALDQHQKVTLKPTDTIVFSSSRIPGNEFQIDNLINLIIQHGCRVLVNDHLTLHASGHGNRDEHKLMLQMTKPKFILPIHGDAKMRSSLRETAIGLGHSEDNIIMAENGYVIELNKDGWRIAEKIQCEPLWVEGDRVGDFDEEIISERKVLTDEGVIIVTAKNTGSDTFSIGDIEILHNGFFVQKSDIFLKEKLPRTLVDHVRSLNDKDRDSVRSGIKRFVENEVTREYGKKTAIVVSVL